MYVLLCWLFNIPSLFISVYALVQEEECSRRNLKMMFGVNAAFSLAHAIFAIYLQTRLFQGLKRAEQELVNQPPAKEQMKRAWDIILYDFGFLFYLFVFFGSFGFNCYVSGWPFLCGTDFLIFLPCLLLIFFFLFACQFAVLWFCVLSCTDCCQSSSVMRLVLGPTPSRQHPSSAAPTVVGQPVVGKPVAQQSMPHATAAQALYASPAEPQPVFSPTAPPASNGMSSGPSAPPEREKPTAGQQAAQTAVAGAAVAMDLGKAGLKKVGGWLQKK